MTYTKSPEAIAKLTELQANPAAKKEIQAHEKLVQAQELEGASEFDKAHKGVRARLAFDL